MSTYTSRIVVPEKWKDESGLLTLPMTAITVVRAGSPKPFTEVSFEEALGCIRSLELYIGIRLDDDFKEDRRSVSLLFIPEDYDISFRDNGYTVSSRGSRRFKTVLNVTGGRLVFYHTSIAQRLGLS